MEVIREEVGKLVQKGAMWKVPEAEAKGQKGLYSVYQSHMIGGGHS